jgi:hypothetical protein
MAQHTSQAPTLGGIRNVYAAMGAENYYAQHGTEYRNPHFATLCEVVPKMLDAMLGPVLRIDKSQDASTQDASTSSNFSCLDFCCGSGEFSRILSSWCERRKLMCSLTGADPFTQQAYADVTGKVAKKWSFEDVCEGKLLDEDGTMMDEESRLLDEENTQEDGKDRSRNTFDVLAISYAIHLLEPSRVFSFFPTMARHAKWMLIISPTKNKGVIDASLGWEPMDYLTDRKVHARFYKSLCYEG